MSSLVEKVRQNYDQGVTKSTKFRLKQLKNFKKFFEDNEEGIIKAIKADFRKHDAEARLEMIIAVNHLRFLIYNLENWTKPEKVVKRFIDVFDGIYVQSEPLGVVLVMGTWNVSVLTILPAAGAIAAGNAVIIKPSHLCPNFSDFVSKTLPKYLNPDLYPVFTGDVEAITNLLQERLDYIYYTGSIKIGRIIHQAANKYLTPVTLELGGKNPVFIDNTANLRLTAKRLMWAKCFNSGHVCIAPDYILCSKEIAEAFIEFAKEALDSFGRDYKYRCIFNDFHFKRLKSLMEGLKIALGGYSDPLENILELTIATDVDPGHPIMQEEIFGPILPIIYVNSLGDAVKFINRREKPLSAYIFTEDSKSRDFFIKNTSSGGVSVNDCLMDLVIERLPFGGVGSSGMGKYKGKCSFDTFSNKKSVLDRSTSRFVEFLQGIRYPPHSKRKVDIMAILATCRKEYPLGWVLYLMAFAIGILIGYLIFKS